MSTWKRAAAWIAFLGPFFFLSYGFANWLASRRSVVGAIAYPWERSIPFVPWTIVPYWSVDLLYVVSVFVCTTKKELDRHAYRLLFVQLVSIACFIAFPLRFSFERPTASGVFGALFTALGSFDKPFNQAPSLHIGLLIVIWACLDRHVARGKLALHVWMTLIGLSILTTYQHHFIDLPTGLLVGFLSLWAVPDDAPSPLKGITITRDPMRRRLAALYAVGAIIFAVLGAFGGVWLWLFWPAIATALVALNYVAIGERGFQKASNGRLSAGARALFAPYLAAAWANSRLWTRGHLLPAEVVDGVSIGRIPGRRELEHSKFSAVVDLTAELSCVTQGRSYRGVPILDLTVPCAESLREAAEAIEEARSHGPVLVCCALGYSRSAAAVVAWLLTTQRAGTVDAAMRMVQKARPAIVLKSEHCAALESFA